MAELVALVGSHSSPLPSERAIQWLRALGGLTVPAALACLDSSPDKWLWAKLLADIGITSAEVSDALERTMTNKHLDEPDRSWAAAALSRLGRMDLVVKRLDSIPPGVAVQGFAAPYTSFRDHGAHGPLDYAPLENALAVCPDRRPDVSEQLAPGRGSARSARTRPGQRSRHWPRRCPSYGATRSSYCPAHRSTRSSVTATPRG